MVEFRKSDLLKPRTQLSQTFYFKIEFTRPEKFATVENMFEAFLKPRLKMEKVWRCGFVYFGKCEFLQVKSQLGKNF